MFYQQPIVQLAASSILFGLGAVFVVFMDLDATVIAFYRLFIAGICFGFYLWLKKEPLNISKNALKYAVLAGVFFGGDLAMWNTSILIVGPGIATILNSLQVFFMAGFGIWLFHDKPSKKLFISLLLTFLGVVLLSIDEIQRSSAGLWGIVIGTLSAVAFAASMLCLREAARHQTNSVVNTMFYASFAGAVATAIYAGIDGSSFLIPNAKTWVMILIYGGFVHVFSWFLMANSMPHLAVAVVGLMMCLEPVVAFFIDVAFLGKHMALIQFVGAAMTIGAIYLGTQSSKKRKNKASSK